MRREAFLNLSRLALMLTFFQALAWSAAGYENGFPADHHFFPIGVWLQSTRNAAEFADIGVNTYVGISGGASETGLEQLALHHMFAIATLDSFALNARGRPVIKGWIQPDEPDDAQPFSFGLHGPCIPAAEVERRTRAIARQDPTRPVMINFGPGVADSDWRGRGTCRGDLAYYDKAIQGAGIISFDIYPVASDIDHVKGKLQYVARGIQELVRRAHQGQSVWAIIESSALDSLHPVKPDQLRSEVWMALIHGANGIVYFAHEWKPAFREDALFRHSEIVNEARQIDARISNLATVLNSPTAVDAVVASSPIPIATMLKAGGHALYLFAVAMDDQPASVVFTIPGIRDAEAIVLDENRRVPVHDGILRDFFSGYRVHLYEISDHKDIN